MTAMVVMKLTDLENATLRKATKQISRRPDSTANSKGADQTLDSLTLIDSTAEW